METKSSNAEATPVTTTVGPSQESYPLVRANSASAQTTVPTMAAGSTGAQRSDRRPSRHRATTPAPARAATAGAITTV